MSQEKKNFNKKDRPKNVELECPVIFTPSVNGGQEYTDESAINALVHLDDQVLPTINVPLVMQKCVAMNDDNKKGVLTIGYVIGYSDNLMRVGIYNRYNNVIENKDLAVKINVIAKDNEVVKFTSFEAVFATVEEEE